MYGGGSVLGMPWRALLVCRLQLARTFHATASPAFLWAPVPRGSCYREDSVTEKMQQVWSGDADSAFLTG